jgi:hypothetical protein
MAEMSPRPATRRIRLTKEETLALESVLRAADQYWSDRLPGTVAEDHLAIVRKILEDRRASR